MALALLIALPLAACDSRAHAGDSAQLVASPTPVVIAISVDGLNPMALRKLGSAVPNYNRLIHGGAATFNARAAYELTDTLPNHTGMMTGRLIDTASGHHVRFNADRPSSWLAQVAGYYRPSLFDRAHDAGMTTGLYVSKEKFDFLNRSWNATHGAVDHLGADNGRDKISLYVRAEPDELAQRVVADLVKTERALTFWHISNPDAAGHAHGFMSASYLSAVRTTDRYLGRLFAALDADRALKARTTIILTADHGGNGASHRDPTRLSNYRIPFMVWGRGAAVNAHLYALNPSRRDPGYSRPTYAGVQPVRNTDVANLAARLLGQPNVVSFSNRASLRTR